MSTSKYWAEQLSDLQENASQSKEQSIWFPSESTTKTFGKAGVAKPDLTSQMLAGEHKKSCNKKPARRAPAPPTDKRCGNHEYVYTDQSSDYAVPHQFTRNAHGWPTEGSSHHYKELTTATIEPSTPYDHPIRRGNSMPAMHVNSVSVS